MTDSGTYKFVIKRQRVLFRFDDDEPHEIGTLQKGDPFQLTLKDNWPDEHFDPREGMPAIVFEKNGKKFNIYLEDIE